MNIGFKVADVGEYEKGLALHIAGGVKLLESTGVGLTVKTTFCVFEQPFADKLI